MSDGIERLENRIRAIAPLDADRILDAVFAETVAGATIDEMSRAMGEIRLSRGKATYAELGKRVWELRYKRAGEEEERYKEKAKERGRW